MLSAVALCSVSTHRFRHSSCRGCNKPWHRRSTVTAATERTGFTSAVNTVDEAVRLNATDPDSLQNLYRRTYADVPLLLPLENDASIPHQKVIPFRNDLMMLDAALSKGGVSNG